MHDCEAKVIKDRRYSMNKQVTINSKAKEGITDGNICCIIRSQKLNGIEMAAYCNYTFIKSVKNEL